MSARTKCSRHANWEGKPMTSSSAQKGREAPSSANNRLHKKNWNDNTTILASNSSTSECKCSKKNWISCIIRETIWWRNTKTCGRWQHKKLTKSSRTSSNSNIKLKRSATNMTHSSLRLQTQTRIPKSGANINTAWDWHKSDCNQLTSRLKKPEGKNIATKRWVHHKSKGLQDHKVKPTQAQCSTKKYLGNQWEYHGIKLQPSPSTQPSQ